MSDDPETARQIAELAADERPLLVLDVDEVLLEFVRPFMSFLDSHGLEHKLNSFRLHGNILDRESGLAIEDARVTGLIDDFFAAQHDWQTVAEGAVEAVAELAQPATTPGPATEDRVVEGTTEQAPSDERLPLPTLSHRAGGDGLDPDDGRRRGIGPWHELAFDRSE